MAKMMKAAVIEKPNHLVVKQVPVPEITDNEVLIKVKYTGICGTDWSIYTGKYSADKLPLIAGHEFSGTIAQVGKKTRGLKEGDRVTADINMSCGTCFYCRQGQKLMCRDFHQLGIHVDGTYADYVKAPFDQVHVLPDSLDFLSGAFIEPLSCVIHSSKAAKVTHGSSVAVIGSGLGVLHGLLARLRGAAPVIVIGDNAKRLAIAKGFGVDVTININDGKDPVAEVKRLTGGRGADFVVEAVGTPKTYEQALEMVRPGGTLAAFGICAGDDTIKVRPFDLVLGEKTIVGSCAGVGTDWTDAMALLAHGHIKPQPMFSMIVPVEELEDALKQLRSDPNLIKVFVSTEISKREILSK
ncbi:MAG: alcohol dehydrogenase catalytic domain-containing protein [Acidobacteria bacterium]|nr:alcohol dehydrogenase catalytic domain-containing protein [Acidobacteriota bacterium]